MKSYGVTIQMKATEQYFPVVLFIVLYKVVLTFESVDEILWCDHSNETSLAELLHNTIYFLGFYNKKFLVIFFVGNYNEWLKGLSTKEIFPSSEVSPYGL